MDTCKELSGRFQTDGDPFLQLMVTADESWVYHFQPETKRASKEWRHSNSPKPNKFLANLLWVK
jgi:hypothetical protein